ncbi:unnamed protein product [Ixodes pacificus]
MRGCECRRRSGLPTPAFRCFCGPENGLQLNRRLPQTLPRHRQNCGRQQCDSFTTSLGGNRGTAFWNAVDGPVRGTFVAPYFRFVGFFPISLHKNSSSIPVKDEAVLAIFSGSCWRRSGAVFAVFSVLSSAL